MSSAHLALREATREWHQRIEAQPLFQQLLSPEITAEDLRETLTVLHEFYARIEPSMQAYFPHSSQLPYLPRSNALESDLATLGGHIKKQLDAYDIADKAAAWGARYVLEGASLGGRVIARHLKEKLPSVATTLKFYLDTPELTMPWSQLMSALELQLKTPEEINKATTTACHLFGMLHDLAKR